MAEVVIFFTMAEAVRFFAEAVAVRTFAAGLRGPVLLVLAIIPPGGF